MNAAAVANRLWAASCLPEEAALRRAVARPRPVQESLLARILGANAGSAYGRAHGFAHVRTHEEYVEAVPPVTWEDVAPLVERIAEGERGMLTSEPVLSFEPTSGSSGPTKLVPMTASLRAQFARGVAAWVSDLFRTVPGLLDGRAYWSVSPAVPQRATPAGLAVGFDADDAYAGRLRSRLARTVQAVDPSVRSLPSADAFRRATLRSLVAAGDLALVSVWNPTFFSLLLDALSDQGEEIAADVERDHPSRAGVLRRGLEAGDRAALTALLWPRLRLVSAWADAAAAPASHVLAAELPHARFQPKGLIATEAFVSLPVSWAPGHVPALRSHFFEFLAEGSSDALPVWALEPGARYEVVVTTGGGLYRYRTGDLVEAGERVGACPTLRFLGRGGAVSDRFGEKLSEAHVASAVRKALEGAGERARFAAVAFDDRAPAPGYVLLVDAVEARERVAALVEQALGENFHYAYCRRLGQLRALRAVRARPDAARLHLEESVRRGLRAGDVKPPVLLRGDGWVALLGEEASSGAEGGAA